MVGRCREENDAEVAVLRHFACIAPWKIIFMGKLFNHCIEAAMVDTVVSGDGSG